nr:AraC family transcriptional regulator [Oscillospiraceae bacterium]
GYAEYYLSRKFKAETGLSINNYIKIVKVERAKTLLLSTNLDIQEICDLLGFGSRSFFSQTFRKIVGVPPAAYREQHQPI